MIWPHLSRRHRGNTHTGTHAQAHRGTHTLARTRTDTRGGTHARTHARTHAGTHASTHDDAFAHKAGILFTNQSLCKVPAEAVAAVMVRVLLLLPVPVHGLPGCALRSSLLLY